MNQGRDWNCPQGRTKTPASQHGIRFPKKGSHAPPLPTQMCGPPYPSVYLSDSTCHEVQHQYWIKKDHTRLSATSKWYSSSKTGELLLATMRIAWWYLDRQQNQCWSWSLMQFYSVETVDHLQQQTWQGFGSLGMFPRQGSASRQRSSVWRIRRPSLRMGSRCYQLVRHLLAKGRHRVDQVYLS